MKAKLLFLLIAIADIVAVIISLVRCLHTSSVFNIAVIIVFAFSAIVLAEIGETKLLSRRQPLAEPNLDEKDLIPPVGLGGYVPDVPAIGGYTTREAADALTLMARSWLPMEADEPPVRYDEPMAMYPIKME